MSGGTKWITADTTACEQEPISSHAECPYLDCRHISHLDEAGSHAQALPRKRL